MSHGSSGSSHAPEFVAALKSADFDFFTGVPCSLLKDLVSILDHDEDLHYISATREDSAIGMAFGARLAGKTPMVLMQNSGLGAHLARTHFPAGSGVDVPSAISALTHCIIGSALAAVWRRIAPRN